MSSIKNELDGTGWMTGWVFTFQIPVENLIYKGHSRTQSKAQYSWWNKELSSLGSEFIYLFAKLPLFFNADINLYIN